MKKIIYCILLSFLFIGCNDNVKPKEDDLKKYPWMEIFTSGRVDFKGIEHNTDLGTYSFSFKTSYESIDTYFMRTDSCALKNKWEMVQKSYESRKYKKKSSIYKASEGFDIVTLTFDSINNSITFKSSVNR